MAIFGDSKKKTKQEKTEKEPTTAPVKKATPAQQFFTLKSPVVSEKSVNGNATGKYTFIVNDTVNKVQIKQAVESRYGVKVSGVRVITIPGKKVMVRRREGWRPGFKKAIVSLPQGQRIEQI
jgi:large subunit ribosomal protein L23